MSEKLSELEKACKNYYDNNLKHELKETRKSKLCVDDGKIVKEYIIKIGWLLMLIAIIFPILIYIKKNTTGEAIIYFIITIILLTFGLFLSITYRKIGNKYCKIK